ncbi:ABC transporter substrate-binding protein [Pontibacter sp. JAM-7]|uniref:ABC transporter substrate-binding protein n=1 Tax=Pontibacter sp. JAM-7 TaxID=3366581 RepID=UPI003AF7897E
MSNRNLIFVLFLIIVGCGLGESETDAVLQVGTNQWPGYEPLYLADSKGFYGEQSVRVVLLPSASEVMRALRNEVIDVAGLTLDEALQLASSGVALKLFMVTDISAGADVILAHPEIENIQSLAGKRVGVETTALGAYVLSRALQLAGVDSDKVHLVDLQVDQHEEAFTAGRVDAVVTFEPVRTKLLTHGAQILFDSRQIPEEVVDVLVVRESAIEQHEASLKLLVDGWFKARSLLEEQNANAMLLAAKHQGLTVYELRGAMAGLELPNRSRVRYLLAEKALVDKAAPVQHWMRQQGLLRGEAVDLESLLLPGYL